jgi:hypothetical protein
VPPPPRLAVLALAVAALAGCSRGDGDRLVLDGRPRHPDAEGVVSGVTLERITLDGNRSWPLRNDLQSFSTYDLAATPVLHRQGHYVQVGLQGKEVAWVAGIGVVVTAGRPVVFYNGHLRRIEEGRAIFRDGTVLRLAKGVRSPVDEGPVRAEIDPAAHRVRALAPQ